MWLKMTRIHDSKDKVPNLYNIKSLTEADCSHYNHWHLATANMSLKVLRVGLYFGACRKLKISIIIIIILKKEINNIYYNKNLLYSFFNRISIFFLLWRITCHCLIHTA